MSKKKRTTKQPARRPAGWVLPVLAGALLLGVLAWLVWRGSDRTAPIAAGGTPSLEADQEHVDVGDVQLGQTVAVNFRLTNTGDGTLRFNEAPYVEVVEGC